MKLPKHKKAKTLVAARVDEADLAVLKKNNINVSEFVRAQIKKAADKLR